MQRINPITIGFIVGLLLSFALGYATFNNSAAKDSFINIAVSPKGSPITIDGKSMSGGDKLAVISGTHTVTAIRKGFSGQKQVVTVQPGASAYVGFILQPNADETKDWYSENPDDEKLAEGISSNLNDTESNDALKQNPFLSKTPVSFGDGRRGLITISSGVPLDGSKQPAFYVEAETPEDHQTALSWIRTSGYDPTTMDIVFYTERAIFKQQDSE